MHNFTLAYESCWSKAHNIVVYRHAAIRQLYAREFYFHVHAANFAHNNPNCQPNESRTMFDVQNLPRMFAGICHEHRLISSGMISKQKQNKMKPSDSYALIFDPQIDQYTNNHKEDAIVVCITNFIDTIYQVLKFTSPRLTKNQQTNIARSHTPAVCWWLACFHDDLTPNSADFLSFRQMVVG